mmetsp:Transcript_120104/g.285333  ORF Transcript_120104/g.285333 Transcript_120104/m.285333 type:complete len:205 (+) Transcript_120104:275-889(+)
MAPCFCQASKQFLNHLFAISSASSVAPGSCICSRPSTNISCRGAHAFGASHCWPEGKRVVLAPPTCSRPLVFRASRKARSFFPRPAHRGAAKSEMEAAADGRPKSKRKSRKLLRSSTHNTLLMARSRRAAAAAKRPPPSRRRKKARCRSMRSRTQLRSTGTTLCASTEAMPSLAFGSQRVEKSQPVSAPDLMPRYTSSAFLPNF